MSAPPASAAAGGPPRGDAPAAASRAVAPSARGVVERDGVRLAWSSFGDGPRTVLLMPTWSIVPSRFWKPQVPFLSRHARVVTFDGRGSGGSDRPDGAPAYADEEYAADALAVMDAAGVERAVLVGFSCGVSWSVRVAAAAPERVRGLVAIGTACGLGIDDPVRDEFVWSQRHPHARGWAKYNRHHWLEGGYHDFLEFFFAQMFPEPHSTKQIEDCVAWALDVGPETLVATVAGRTGLDGAVCTPVEPLARQVRCPVLVLHGTDDTVRTVVLGERLAELTGGELVRLEGSGHGPTARDPVLLNHLLQGFLDRVWPRPPRARTVVRRPAGPRVLYLSSPIGLGHAHRDLAVARELRRLRPEVQVTWLAQDPVTRVLAAAGEEMHPASAHLANESTHVEHESGEHDLHAFHAIRRMDEILVNNFMVFDELTEGEQFDLVVGDEAWDVDYFLHENPRLKRSAYAWFTDFVGWLPMPDGGAREAMLTADLNAEMIEQRARLRWLRDRSLFVGNPGDVVDEPFGPGLPDIRAWTKENFEFPGFITGFDPAALPPREELRGRLGVADDERLCVVSVGGSGVGRTMLTRVLDAVPLVRRVAPDLRFLVVAGPRIDPASLPRRRGARVVGFVPRLTEALAACDVAVVQGGLATCMELAALRRPFLYVPLRHHFEQSFHVRHRLDRYGAGTCLDYERLLEPDAFAAALLAEVGREVDYRPVETDGATRAAGLLAELV